MADLERGKRIKAFRKKKAERLGERVTQQHMADFVGVSLRAAQEWEYGGGIDDDHLGPLLDFLEVDADELLRGQDEPVEETPDLIGDLTVEITAEDLREIHRKLDEIIRRLPPEEPAKDDEPGETLPPDALPDDPDRPPDVRDDDEPPSEAAE